MNFRDLTVQVSQDTGFSRAQVAEILRSLQTTIGEAVKAGEKVVLPGLGVFLPRDIEPKTAFGGRVRVSGRRAIIFRQSRRNR